MSSWLLFILIGALGLRKKDVEALIRLIHQRVPGVRIDDWEFEQMDDGVLAATSAFGTVKISESNKGCISYNQFKELLDSLLHEGMHASDSFWQRRLDAWAQPDMTENHSSIYLRVQWEMGYTALFPNPPAGTTLSDFRGRRGSLPFTGNLWGLGEVTQMGDGRKKSGLLDYTQELYESFYPNGTEGCECEQ